MLRYAARRLLELIPTTLGILLLAFVLINLVVGSSPALTILWKGAVERSIAAFNKRYGYDKPLIVGKWGSVSGCLWEVRSTVELGGASRDSTGFGAVEEGLI